MIKKLLLSVLITVFGIKMVAKRFYVISTKELEEEGIGQGVLKIPFQHSTSETEPINCRSQIRDITGCTMVPEST